MDTLETASIGIMGSKALAKDLLQYAKLSRIDFRLLISHH